MEQMNRVELRGNIGNVRCTELGERTVNSFTLATSVAKNGRDGQPFVETTWHSINAWQNKNMPDLKTLAKGMTVTVIGRIRTNKYTGADGVERSVQEIQATSIHIEEEMAKTENLL